MQFSFCVCDTLCVYAPFHCVFLILLHFCLLWQVDSDTAHVEQNVSFSFCSIRCMFVTRVSVFLVIAFNWSLSGMEDERWIFLHPHIWCKRTKRKHKSRTDKNTQKRNSLTLECRWVHSVHMCVSVSVCSECSADVCASFSRSLAETDLSSCPHFSLFRALRSLEQHKLWLHQTMTAKIKNK